MSLQVQRGGNIASTHVIPRCENGVGGQHDGVVSLHPQKRKFTHYTGGWVGPGAGLDVHKISYYYRDSIPVPPGHSKSLCHSR
jgi:hypothetical protein